MKHIGLVNDRGCPQYYSEKELMNLLNYQGGRRIYSDEIPMYNKDKLMAMQLKGARLMIFDATEINNIDEWEKKRNRIVPLTSWVRARDKALTKLMEADDLYKKGGD